MEQMASGGSQAQIVVGRLQVQEHRVAHIDAQGSIADRKHNAGANMLLRRHAIRPQSRAPRRVRTNIEVPALPLGKQTLYFFPDRLLVFESATVGAVPYEALRVSSIEVRLHRRITRQSTFCGARARDPSLRCRGRHRRLGGHRGVQASRGRISHCRKSGTSALAGNSGAEVDNRFLKARSMYVKDA
jgi:hypothetical protein